MLGACLLSGMHEATSALLTIGLAVFALRRAVQLVGWGIEARAPTEKRPAYLAEARPARIFVGAARHSRGGEWRRRGVRATVTRGVPADDARAPAREDRRVRSRLGETTPPPISADLHLRSRHLRDQSDPLQPRRSGKVLVLGDRDALVSERSVYFDLDVHRPSQLLGELPQRRVLDANPDLPVRTRADFDRTLEGSGGARWRRLSLGR